MPCIHAYPCLFIYKNLQVYSILIILLCAVGRRKRRKSKLLTHKEARCNLLEAWISCASVDCLHPHNKQNVVSWVQCDDCNAWYHVKCTGLTLKSVKPKTAKFHCGCVWQKAAPEKRSLVFVLYTSPSHKFVAFLYCSGQLLNQWKCQRNSLPQETLWTSAENDVFGILLFC